MRRSRRHCGRTRRSIRGVVVKTRCVRSSGRRGIAVSLSLSLSLPLFLAGLPLAADAGDAGGPLPSSPPDSAPVEEAEPTVEVLTERTETTKTFETDVPGVMVTDVYAEPVHFEDPDTGQMVEIDTTLEPTSDGGLVTTAVPVPIEIAAEANDGEMVTVDLGAGRSASFGVEGSAPAPALDSVAGETVTFDGLVPDAALTLEATGTGVKETLVLDSPAAPSVWRFPLTLEGLTAELDPELGHVLLRPSGETDGEAIAMVPHGWMTDAAFGTRPDEASSYSEGVAYTLEETDEGVVLVVELDESWLNDPVRVWPVTVDPTLTQIDGSGDDTYVTPYVTTDRSTLPYLYAGSLGMFFNRSYLHLDTSAFAGQVIHFADFNALQTDGRTCSATNVDLYRVTSPWSGLNLTWTSQPTVAPTPVTTATTAQSTLSGSGCTAAQWATWGVSDLVRNWADGTWENNGISLRAPTAQALNPDFWKKFGSADATWKPHLHVIWSEPGASGSPHTPTDLVPTGVIGDPNAPLAATFADPEGDDGRVIFEVYDDASNQLLGLFVGSTVASGGTSTYVPTQPADHDRTYRIRAHAMDAANNWSVSYATTTMTVSSTALSDPSPGMCCSTSRPSRWEQSGDTRSTRSASTSTGR